MEYLSDSLPLPKSYSNSHSRGIKPNSSTDSSPSPSQRISETTNNSYSFSKEIVDNYFNASKKEKHPLVKEVNQILKELEVKNMDKPDLHLELTITELIEKFGQNDLTIELIRNTLGLDSSTVKT